MSVAKFFGCESTDEVVQNEHFKANQKAFFENGNDMALDRRPANQSYAAAVNVFHGNDEKPRGQVFEAPIPGYSGHTQRLEADCIFGQTFANAMDQGSKSIHRIKDERAETVKKATNKFPNYKDVVAARMAQ